MGIVLHRHITRIVIMRSVSHSQVFYATLINYEIPHWSVKRIKKGLDLTDNYLKRLMNAEALIFTPQLCNYSFNYQEKSDCGWYHCQQKLIRHKIFHECFIKFQIMIKIFCYLKSVWKSFLSLAEIFCKLMYEVILSVWLFLQIIWIKTKMQLSWDNNINFYCCVSINFLAISKFKNIFITNLYKVF